MEHNRYNNPLTTRYATAKMSEIFSEQRRIEYFRKLWIALAKGEKALGLDITDEQIKELEAHITDIDFDLEAEREKIVRHDVMAHIYTYGVSCPSAAPIIHLGATSCYVTDNADILVYREAIALLKVKIVAILEKFSRFASKYRATPTLGYTHLQPAQLVTVGKRATLWMQDFLIDLDMLEHALSELKLRGVKGTTGTQASFLSLFNGDHAKVDALDKFVCSEFGDASSIAVSGQTYTRKLDYIVVSALSGFAQSAYKFAQDIRILQSYKEIEEPFAEKQIGSSAMAYKRNPMRSERVCSLSRYLVSLPLNPAMTACSQGFERTLDDSANRRIVMGEAFLTADAICELVLNISGGLVVYENVINRRVMEEIPFMATENILMSAVKRGGNRQELHEKIRTYSMEAEKKFRTTGEPNDLLERLKSDPDFAPIIDGSDILSPVNYIGRAPEQVDAFINDHIKPVLEEYKNELSSLSGAGEIRV